ncbi:MAG TPA: tetratricopeptide repeat protein [Edaphocola sp.]|nr:tetratricopeptide repeat protein [Edaphocola sp.]
MAHLKIPVRKVLPGVLCLVFPMFWTLSGRAQEQDGARAQIAQWMSAGHYEQALPAVKSLYRSAPFDKAVYQDYLEVLLQLKQYDSAGALVRYMMRIRRGDPVMLVDLGRVAQSAGHKKAANDYFDQAVAQLPRNDFDIKALAEAFENTGRDDYAIKTYLEARSAFQNPYAFATELALLYQKTGDGKAAINALLDKAMTQVDIMDDLHDALAQVAAKDKNGLKAIRRSLNDRLKAQPGNPAWQALLSWTYTLDGDYGGALENLVKLDEQFKEQGKRVVIFARDAAKAEQFAVARNAYDYVLKKGKAGPYYQQAFAGLLDNGYQRLRRQFPPDPESVRELLAQFRSFFKDYPNYRLTPVWQLYALVEARYHNQPDTAIDLLSQVINDPRADKTFAGRCKLDLGDDYLLAGQIWNATLMYSQVNKDFEQDELGELARYKNAKWAFYKGDFALAQEQLSVLKASTSRLIANDALYLSVLITENTPPDSNLTPLRRFAAADLLLFKHDPKAAGLLLDSIAKAWPGSPLQDDIAMLRARTAESSGDWASAEKFYKIVVEQYGQDVLGDDAAWQLAELFRTKLKDDAKALKYYKLLIVQYPGSTFVQEAREWYRKLNKDNPET